MARGLSADDRGPPPRNRHCLKDCREASRNSSDEVAGILATGRGDITTLFVSMARRHPEGRDAEYLRWHTLDHRPEQHRLAARAGVPSVGVDAGMPGRTGGGRRALRRDRPCDDVLLHRPGGLTGFSNCHGTGRRGPQAAPAATGPARRLRGADKVAAPRVKIGADVLPWWPIRGVYLLLEAGRAPHRRAARHRRCRRGLVCRFAIGRHEPGERTRRPDAHILLPRRGPGRCSGTAAART